MPIYTITIRIGPHDQANDLMDYMVGEVSTAFNRADLRGVPVQWETGTIDDDELDDDDSGFIEDFEEIFDGGDR